MPARQSRGFLQQQMQPDHPQSALYYQARTYPAGQGLDPIDQQLNKQLGEYLSRSGQQQHREVTLPGWRRSFLSVHEHRENAVLWHVEDHAVQYQQ